METIRKRLAEISSISLELKPTEIIKLSELIIEASRSISTYNSDLSKPLKEAADNCKNSLGLTEKEKFDLFQESRNLLNNNIGTLLNPVD